MTFIPASAIRAFDLMNASSVDRPALFTVHSTGGHKMLVCNGVAVFLAGQWAGRGLADVEGQTRVGSLIEGVEVEIDPVSATSAARDRVLTVQASGDELSMNVVMPSGIVDEVRPTVLRPGTEPAAYDTPRIYFPKWRLVLPVRDTVIVLHEQDTLAS